MNNDRRLISAAEKRCRDNYRILNYSLDQKLKPDKSKMLGTRIHNRWWVSTIYRKCSSAEVDMWYYETYVFLLNKDGSRGKTIYEDEYSLDHWEVCRQLFESGKIKGER